MELTIQEFSQMLLDAANEVIVHKDELTEIDSRFGDADHGITMERIAKQIANTVEKTPGETFKSLLDDIAMNIMTINGGSAVPLWNTFFDGLQEAAPNTNVVNAAEIKTIFKGGLDSLYALSTARVGDKTMMDALIPAIEAIQACEGDINNLFLDASCAAQEGAKNSANFVSKFGRAKSYKEETIGTPDAGAVSMQYFFVGLSKHFNN